MKMIGRGLKPFGLTLMACQMCPDGELYIQGELGDENESYAFIRCTCGTASKFIRLPDEIAPATKEWKGINAELEATWNRMQQLIARAQIQEMMKEERSKKSKSL